MLLRVKDWEKHFENNRTRELKKMQWVPMPNKQDGDGYRELIEDHPNGVAHYGAWCALISVASKCDPRGTLLRDSGMPHTWPSLKRKTGIPVEVWEEAIPRLVETGWLVATPCESTTPQEGAKPPQGNAALSHEPALNGMEGNGRELNGTEEEDKTVPVTPGATTVRVPALVDSINLTTLYTDGKTRRYWGSPSHGILFDRVTVQFLGITDKMLEVWTEANPAVDIILDLKQCAAWVSTNKDGKGCKKNYYSTITNWLARTQGRGGNRGKSGEGKSILPSEKDAQ